jgi:arabinose-5-phosphate isomerase
MSDIINIASQCLRDEAQAVLDQIPLLDNNFERAVKLILDCKGKLIVTGVGKSGHIGAKMAATLSSTGTPSFYLNPLDAYHGDLGVVGNDDIILALSNSGQTDELLRLLPYFQEKKIPVISMSGNPESLLAKNTDVHITVTVRSEASPLGLAPTTSTTATLAVGDALACALMLARDFKVQDFARFHPGGSLGKRLLTTARYVMHKEDLPVVPPEMELGKAIIRVSQGRLGLCVVVVNDEVVGIITDGDVRRAMESSQNRFFSLTVNDIMTKNPKVVTPETKISTIDNILQKNKIHAVLVVDDKNRLVGIVDSFSIML